MNRPRVLSIMIATLAAVALLFAGFCVVPAPGLFARYEAAIDSVPYPPGGTVLRREIHISPLIDYNGQDYARLLVDYGDRDPYALANETAELWSAHGWEVFGRPTWKFARDGPMFEVLSRDVWSARLCCREPTPGEPVALSILVGEA